MVLKKSYLFTLIVPCLFVIRICFFLGDASSSDLKAENQFDMRILGKIYGLAVNMIKYSMLTFQEQKTFRVLLFPALKHLLARP